MKTAIWIIAICEMVKLFTAVVSATTQTVMEAKRKKHKQRIADAIETYNKIAERKSNESDILNDIKSGKGLSPIKMEEER